MVDGKEVANINTAYAMLAENTALEGVFPDKEYWNVEEPRPFDFIANEQRARKIMKDYVESVRMEGGQPSYVTSDMQKRNDVHLASPADNYASALGFEKEFLRVYNVGKELQKQGREPRVSIT